MDSVVLIDKVVCQTRAHNVKGSWSNSEVFMSTVAKQMHTSV